MMGRASSTLSDSYCLLKEDRLNPALNLAAAQGTPLASLVARLQSRPSLPPLVPSEPWNEGLQGVLEGMPEAELLGTDAISDAAFARAVKSGLLLWNDSIAESHTLSQDILNSTGSYWHGIMHRREPDYPNSKYWFRQVGEHPIFPSVREQAMGVFGESGSPYAKQKLAQLEGNSKWDAFAFVDWCEDAARSSDSDAQRLLEAVQLREIELLLTYSYQQAVSR
jgi:hypothetical protein